jgi:pimeloyl-ACP methyl ester carboxylesterase
MLVSRQKGHRLTTARNIDTARLQMYVYESGPADGIPVVLVHGNLATGRFYEKVMDAAPDNYRMVAPDMRSFGRSQPLPIDATRGLRDWADDTASLVEALGISGPVHLVGWSTGGAAIGYYAMDRPGSVASLTFMDPVSPYGYGGTHGTDGAPNFTDFAGSGGGTGNQDFAAAIAAGDTGTDSELSPRSVMRTSYWSPEHHVDTEWEDVLVDEVLLSVPRHRTIGPASPPALGGSSMPCPASTATGPACWTWTPSRLCCGPTGGATSWSPTGRRGT